jgi:hypothetical protein
VTVEVWVDNVELERKGDTMKMVILMLALILMVLCAKPTLADCIYDGRVYPTGTRIGPLECMPDGTWRPVR